MDAQTLFQAFWVPLGLDLPPSSRCSSIKFHAPTIHIFASPDRSLNLPRPLPLLCPLAPTGPLFGHWVPSALTRSSGTLASVLTCRSQAPFLRSLQCLILLPVCLLPGAGALYLTLRFGSQVPPLRSLQSLILLSVCLYLNIHMPGTHIPQVRLPYIRTLMVCVASATASDPQSYSQQPGSHHLSSFVCRWYASSCIILLGPIN